MLITEYFDNLGIKYYTKGKNTGRNSISMKCIFCNDQSNHLSLNLQTGKTICWRCGGKSLTKIIKELSQCSYSEALKVEETLELIVEEKTERRLVNGNILSKFLPLTDSYKNYLENRRFSVSLESKYSLMQAEVYSRYKYRLIIPVIMSGYAVGFTARDITGKSELRYLSCSDNEAIKPKSEWLYNVDSVRDSAMIVEGCTDAWRLGDGAIALMGTGFSEGQVVELIKRKLKRIFIIFDAEENAQQRALSLARRLSPFVKTVEIVNIGSGDPADLSNDDAKYLRKELHFD